MGIYKRAYAVSNIAHNVNRFRNKFVPDTYKQKKGVKMTPFIFIYSYTCNGV